MIQSNVDGKAHALPKPSPLSMPSWFSDLRQSLNTEDETPNTPVDQIDANRKKVQRTIAEMAATERTERKPRYRLTEGTVSIGCNDRAQRGAVIAITLAILSIGLQIVNFLFL